MSARDDEFGLSNKGNGALDCILREYLGSVSMKVAGSVGRGELTRIGGVM